MPRYHDRSGNVTTPRGGPKLSGSSDLMQGLGELHHAREDYQEAWALWDGSIPERFASPKLQRRLAASAGLYGVNIASVPIRVVLDRLRIAAITALTSIGDKWEEADGALNACYDANKLVLQRPRLYRNVLVFGDSYLFVWKGDEDPYPRINYNSPLTCRLIYADDDEITPRLGIKAWRADERWHASLMFADHIEPGWITKSEDADHRDPKSWIRDPDADDIATPDGRIPLVHFRTDLPYGRPDHEDAEGAQAAVNKMARSMTDTAESAGFPSRYGLMEPDADLLGQGMDAPGWQDDFDSPEGSSASDENQYQDEPGSIKLLRGLKDVGTFEAAQPDGFIKPADWFIQAMGIVTGTPHRYLTGAGDTPSGSALRVADAPLQARVETRQLFFDDSERDLAERCLGLLGYTDYSVDVRWKPAGIVDDETTWTIVQAKVASGVPARVALAETGLYDQDEIDGWLADPSVEMDVQRRVWILSDVAASLSGLSQGVAQGLLSEDAARAVVAATIGQLTPELEAAPQ